MVMDSPSRCWTGMRLASQRLSIIAVLLMCAPASLQAGAATLTSADRMLLAEYRALEREKVPLLIATAPERTGAVAAALNKGGAQVIGRRDAIGYLYALVPLDSVASMLTIQGLQAVQVASNPVRGRMDAGSSTASVGAVRPARSKGVPPSAALGPDNPYTGEAATQALDFKSRNPTFDGRGVVTAFVEPIAPNLETMRGALDLSGRPQPKFARYELMAPVSPDEAVADSKQFFVWQKTELVHPAADGTFAWRGRDYRLPADVAVGEIAAIRWRICRHLANFLMPEYDFLWAENREQVWALPASAGGDFSKARSASLREALAWAALDEPASAQNQNFKPKAMIFRTDRRRGLLAAAPTLAGHGGMVGSVMAGSGFMGSQANGVAPAAQISIFLGSRPPNAQSYDGHEVMLEMLSDPRVDVAQASHALGDTSRFGAAAIQTIWADRLIAATGKPFVKAAGNFGPRLHASEEFQMAQSVFAVGAYAPRATWLANMGFEPAGEHVLASYSGWGPAQDGGLKPDFLSLTHTLSEGGGWRWYWGDDTQDYAVSGGTSASAPHGAGNVALLVSAAKQTGVPHDAARLRAAIATSAKFLEGVEARAQGHGLIQVSDAWAALQRAGKWTPPAFEVRAPLVGQEAGPDGPQRFTGRGLFELSGWKPAQTGRRELLVTRQSGAAGANHYLLRWKGHTNVFVSELQKIELPLGRPVSIPLDIRVGDSGSYSAILDLVDPQVQLVAGSILNTVMVADALAPDGEGLRYERESPRPGSSLFYVDVPAGLAALTASLAKDGGKSMWEATDPTGRLLPLRLYGSEVYRSSNEEEFAKREQHFVYADPVPGVWQFELRNGEPRSMADLDAVEDWSRSMPLKVHIQGWTSVDSEPAIVQVSQPVEVRLRAAPDVLDAEIEPLGVGAAHEAEAVLRPGLEPVFFDVQVDAGATSLDVQIDHAEPKARVGLYVFKLPEGERTATTLNSDDTMLVYYDSSLQQSKRYSLDAPPPGRYRVALDPIGVPGEQLKIAYRSVVHHPLYGTVVVRADGNSRTATVAVRAQPADGRRLYAEIGLFKHVAAESRVVLAREGWFVEP